MGFRAKPKVVRPQTASAGGQVMGAEQAALLRAMHAAPGPGKKGLGGLARPRTAATTTIYDESRIKDKLKFLEDLENNIESSINDVVGSLDVYKIMSNRAL